MHLRVVFAALLLAPTAASAQSLSYLGGRAPVLGPQTAITETSCTHQRGTPVSLIVGGGVQQRTAIPGALVGQTMLPTPSSLTEREPVGGIAIQIPLGNTASRNCDDFLAMQTARLKLKLAAELKAAGAISDADYAEAVSAASAALVSANKP